MANDIDITQKILMSHKDIFADIVNGLVFKGKQIVTEENLECYDGINSIFSFSNFARKLSSLFPKLKSSFLWQTRDLAMYVKNPKMGIKIALLGIENQTTVDENMVQRIFDYDAASYMRQIPENKIFPVCTIVLYYGKGEWTSPLTLYDRFSRANLTIPEELTEFVNNYKIKVFDMKKLTDEDIECFKTDIQAYFDFVRRCFTPNKIEIDKIIGGKKNLKYKYDVFNAVYAFGSNKNLNKNKNKTYNRVEEGNKGGITMCNILEQIEKNGEQKGIGKGRKEGFEEGIQVGEQKGIGKGRKEGFEEGVQVGEQKGREISTKETAKKMLSKNYSIDEIKEITGVSDKIIEEIKRKL